MLVDARSHRRMARLGKAVQKRFVITKVVTEFGIGNIKTSCLVLAGSDW